MSTQLWAHVHLCTGTHPHSFSNIPSWCSNQLLWVIYGSMLRAQAFEFVRRHVNYSKWLWNPQWHSIKEFPLLVSWQMLTGMVTAYMNHGRYSLCERLCTCAYMSVCVCECNCVYFKKKNPFKRESRRMEERIGEKRHYSWGSNTGADLQNY